jgi:hypothetical protein
MIGKAAELYAVINNDTDIDLTDLIAGGKYMDANTKFQYYYNTGGIADVEISISSGGAAIVRARTSSTGDYTTIYPKTK